MKEISIAKSQKDGSNEINSEEQVESSQKITRSGFQRMFL
jgi:hypothetical protein